MNILGLLTGQSDYITIVKEFIDKVFIHEARKYHCERKDLKIIIHPEENNDMKIMTYSSIENRILRIIPDKEVQQILTK